MSAFIASKTKKNNAGYGCKDKMCNKVAIIIKEYDKAPDTFLIILLSREAKINCISPHIEIKSGNSQNTVPCHPSILPI